MNLVVLETDKGERADIDGLFGPIGWATFIVS